MKNIYIRLKKRLKKAWKKEYLLWGIIILWTSLFWEGHRIIPGAKLLSTVIPAWIVILNLVFLFIFVTLLVNIENLPTIGIIITLVGFLVSCIFFRIGSQRFPLVSFIGAIMVVLINLVLKIWRTRERSK